MAPLRRRKLLVALPAILTGCAVEKPPDYYKPLPFIVLQDPLPGHGIAYLLRAPHDPAAFTVQLTGKQPFVLEPSTYTVLTFKPGEYSLTGTVSAMFGGTKEAFVPAKFSIQEGQRAFLYVSGITDSSFAVNSIVAGRKGILFVDAGMSLSTVAGSRSWKECSELDAQGLMAASKLKLVE